LSYGLLRSLSMMNLTISSSFLYLIEFDLTDSLWSSKSSSLVSLFSLFSLLTECSELSVSKCILSIFPLVLYLELGLALFSLGFTFFLYISSSYVIAFGLLIDFGLMFVFLLGWFIFLILSLKLLSLLFEFVIWLSF